MSERGAVRGGADRPSRVLRERRHRRIRGKIAGTAERPRLAVFRSNLGIAAQLIDDQSGQTLAAAGLAAAEEVDQGRSRPTRRRRSASCSRQMRKKANIERCVFDRGGYLYHGRVKALAEGAREGGLRF